MLSHTITLCHIMSTCPQFWEQKRNEHTPAIAFHDHLWPKFNDSAVSPPIPKLVGQCRLFLDLGILQVLGLANVKDHDRHASFSSPQELRQRGETGRRPGTIYTGACFICWKQVLSCSIPSNISFNGKHLLLQVCNKVGVERWRVLCFATLCRRHWGILGCSWESLPSTIFQHLPKSNNLY